MDDQTHNSGDDWLAGAVVEAEVHDIQLPGICISFEGLGLPDPDPELTS